jgi:hypothetical protein
VCVCVCVFVCMCVIFEMKLTKTADMPEKLKLLFIKVSFISNLLVIKVTITALVYLSSTHRNQIVFNSMAT